MVVKLRTARPRPTHARPCQSPNETQQGFKYNLAMPIINFNKFIGQTKPDPRLKCLNLQGKDWMLILQKVLENWCHFANQRKEFQSIKWFTTKVAHPIQPDLYECGVFVCFFFSKLITGLPKLL